MKVYNTLIENWDDSFSKAKILIDLQESVNTLDISQDQKTKFSQTIDALLMGDAQSTDEVTLAAKLIE